jgi:hypothetical protein
MILAGHDAALFYRAWGAVLTWVNEQRSIVPEFPPPAPERPIPPELANPIRKVVWAEDALLERFVAERGARLGSAESELIMSWRHRLSGQFVVFKHLQKHSIFMSKDVYGVRGLYSPFAELFPHLPMIVHAVLLPFRDVIVTDGLLESPPMQLSFGAGMRRMFQDQYRRAHAASEVRTRLLPRVAEPDLFTGISRPPAEAAGAPSTTRAGLRLKHTEPGFHGRWRITSTEIWDRETLDRFEPAFLRFDGRTGQLGMIAIGVELDCRYGERDGHPLVEFTFAGDDDGHPCYGRGWAVPEGDATLCGHLYLHDGDDSGFVAERVATSTSKSPRRERAPRRR